MILHLDEYDLKIKIKNQILKRKSKIKFEIQNRKLKFRLRIENWFEKVN
mgnify:CR=1 FL=1